MKTYGYWEFYLDLRNPTIVKNELKLVELRRKDRELYDQHYRKVENTFGIGWTRDEFLSIPYPGELTPESTYREINQIIDEERKKVFYELMGEDILVLGDNETIEIHYTTKGTVWYRIYCGDEEPEKLKVFDSANEFLEEFGFFNLMKLLPTEEE